MKPENTVCIFIDGENLRHSIVDLFDPDFKSHHYLPQKADWSKFFGLIASKAAGELKRTYWYVVEHLDVYPYNLPDNEEQLKNIFQKFSPLKHEIQNLKDKELTDFIFGKKGELEKAAQGIRKRFDGWRTIHDGIISKCDFLEFRRAGSIKYDLVYKKLKGEKGVDVKLVVDLLQLSNIYDTAVIVSGDQDYVPAVQCIKDMGKHVVNVAFKKKNGAYLPGGAYRLNQITDQVLDLDYKTCKSILFPEKTINLDNS